MKRTFSFHKQKSIFMDGFVVVVAFYVKCKAFISMNLWHLAIDWKRDGIIFECCCSNMKTIIGMLCDFYFKFRWNSFSFFHFANIFICFTSSANLIKVGINFQSRIVSNIFNKFFFILFNRLMQVLVCWNVNICENHWVTYWQYKMFRSA